MERETDVPRTVSADAVNRWLVALLERVHAGVGNSSGVTEAFRAARILVLLDGSAFRAVERDGLRWVLAFTSEDAARTFLVARGEQHAGLVDYRLMLGRRLLDDFIPAADAPAGVALDLGSDHPMLLPPFLDGQDADRAGLERRDSVAGSVDESTSTASRVEGVRP